MKVLQKPIILLVSLAMILSVAACWGAQHPDDHPTSKKAAAKKAAELTKEALAKEIKNYIEKDARIKGGYFLFYDQKDKRPLQLTLVKVHEDKLASLGNDVYFACCDFKAADGVMYDLDIFMKQTETGLEPTEIAVHKVDGKERYTWVEEKGIWKKKEIKQ